MLILKRMLCHNKWLIFNSFALLMLLITAFPFDARAIDITLAWDENPESNIDGYRVFCCEEGQSFDYKKAAWEGTETVCTIYNLDDKVNYCFVSRAFNTAGTESNDSKKICYDAPLEPLPPVVVPVFWQEAEDGTTVTPMRIVFDDVASGGAYIETSIINSGTVSYNFAVDASGVYKIVARVYAAHSGSDSFFVNIDGHGEFIWALNTGDSLYNTWREDAVTNSGSYNPQDPYLTELSKGTHSIVFRGRERYAGFDYFYLEKVGEIQNVPPIADDQYTTTSEDEAGQITLTASDPDGDSLSWVIFNQPSHGALSGNAPDLVYTPKPDFNGTDSFIFNVSDGKTESSSAIVTISVAPVNDPPIADAGLDKTVDEKTLFQLDGSDSTDLDDGIVSYLWRQIGGAPVSLSDEKAMQLVFIGPEVGTQGESLLFELTVKDSEGLSSTDVCTVTIVNVEPVDNDGDGLTDDDELSVYGTNPSKIDTDEDGIPDGEEMVFWGADWMTDIDGDGLANLLDFDSDNDGYSDGVELKAGSDPADTHSKPEIPLIETAELIVTHDWQRVGLARTFNDPVVVATSFSNNESAPGVVRIRGVDTEGFEIRIQEWDYLDGVHLEESVSYLVIDHGVYYLPDGTMIKADRRGTNNTSSFETVYFEQSFQQAPVVLTAVTSDNGSEAVTTRMLNVTGTSFQVVLQEQELNAQPHVSETISYIAWEPSSGSLGDFVFTVSSTDEVVTHNWNTVVFGDIFQEPPVLLADMQTQNDGNSASMRWQNKDASGVDLKIAEEQSHDSEVSHVAEAVGYIACSTTVKPTVQIWIEAEDGYFNAPMEVGSDDLASSGLYAWAPKGTGLVKTPTEQAGYADYVFTVPVAGDYMIWGLIVSNDSASDSFFVSIDSGEYLVWHTLHGGTETWVWDTVSKREWWDPRDPSNPVLYNLQAGQHTLTIMQREGGTKIDAIVITNDIHYQP